MTYDPSDQAEAMRRGDVGLGQDEALAAGDSLVLDGNAVAGLLEETLGWDVTAEVAQCASCWNVAEGGTLLAFVGGPGTVLRCSVCHEVVVRIVRTDQATYVDARGMSYLRISEARPG